MLSFFLLSSVFKKARIIFLLQNCECTSRHNNLVLIRPDSLAHNSYMKNYAVGVVIWNGFSIQNKIDYGLCGQLDEPGLRSRP